MDDDQERRGRPTVHVRYGEATAILVGDALLAQAFAQLATPGAAPELVARLAQAAGSRALVGGQADDLAFAAGADALERILSIHQRKTAALFQYAGWGGARALGATAAQEKALEDFGRHYGMAYQLLDDLRDADPKECSILSLLAEDEVRARAEAEVAKALEALAPCAERAVALRGLAGRLLGWLT
jgi:geranylgeranyl pyrophosphate synthase